MEFLEGQMSASPDHLHGRNPSGVVPTILPLTKGRPDAPLLGGPDTWARLHGRPAPRDAAGHCRVRATVRPAVFHTDPLTADSSFFGGLAASGWHTGALSM